MPESQSTYSFNVQEAMRRATTVAQSGGRATLPLVSFPNLKHLMIYMPAGSRWNEHSTPGRVSVQVLKGKIRMRALEKNSDLGAGEVFAVDSSIKHDVEALEESWFLLTVARCD